MHNIRRIGFLLLGVMLAGFWCTPLAAQEGITTSPTQINVMATRGETDTRIVLLQSDAALRELSIVPLDLIGADGNVVLPSEAIRVDLPAPSIAAQGILTVPLHFDLREVPSGQFSGDLLISYDGGSQVLPVSVAVKDVPWWALGALVGGVALGVGVSTYRAQGRPRDEILVQLGQIQTQIRVDKDLADAGRPFYNRLETELVDVEVALSGQRWDEARQALAEAEAIWLGWRRGRPDWLEQLRYYQMLTDKLGGWGNNILYIEEIRQATRSAYQSIPDLGNPGKFREILSPLTKHLNDFMMLDAQLKELAQRDQVAPQARALADRLYMLKPADQEGYHQLVTDVETAKAQAQQAETHKKMSKFEELCSQLPEAESETWTTKAKQFQERLADMEGASPAAYVALSHEIDQAMKQAYTLVGDSANFSFSVGESKGVPEIASAQVALLSDVPQTRVQALGSTAIKARRRLSWFTWLTYGVTVVLLALAGFVELYSSRPDFGAGGIADYFTLLAWGFGAEATRSAVADMVHGWGISTGKT